MSEDSRPTLSRPRTWSPPRPSHTLLRWLYRDGHPNSVGRWWNRSAAWQFRHGILSFGGAELQVRGRRSGKPVTLPVVPVRRRDGVYLVSMLGETNWVRNVRAAEGQATLRDRHAHEVVLTEVPIGERPGIIKAYLRAAPGGRPHIPVHRDAPLADFAAIAADHPVFRVDPRLPVG